MNSFLIKDLMNDFKNFSSHINVKYNHNLNNDCGFFYFDSLQLKITINLTFLHQDIVYIDSIANGSIWEFTTRIDIKDNRFIFENETYNSIIEILLVIMIREGAISTNC